MKTLWTSIKMLIIFTILTGILYPLAVTGIAKIFFAGRSGGSIVYRNGVAVGSSLIGQKFDTAVYFSSRPSAIQYNPLPSGGSNLGQTSAKLRDNVKTETRHFLTLNNADSTVSVPPEMVFASASGLDPHISPESAELQLDRIAKARHFNENQKRELVELIKKHTEPPQFNLLGETRINVLLLNLDLDTIK